MSANSISASDPVSPVPPPLADDYAFKSKEIYVPERAYEYLDAKCPLHYVWQYATEKADLRALYEKSKHEQWNATTSRLGHRRRSRGRERPRRDRSRSTAPRIWDKLTPTRRSAKLRREHAVVDAVAVPARRAGRAAGHRADRRRGAVHRRQVLRRDAGHGRGAPRRGRTSATCARRSTQLPDQPAPEARCSTRSSPTRAGT